MAKVKPGRIRWQWLLHIPQWFWSALVLPCLRGLTNSVQSLRRQLVRDPVFTAVTFLTLVLVSVSLLNFLPFAVPFEGVLTVSEIGFTTTRSAQLLLKDIRGIQQITLSGRQTIPLEGTGFSSKDEPRLNGDGRRNIELDDEGGQWTLSSTSPQASEIALSGLTLASGTRIRDLRYSPFNRTLSLRLIPADKPVAGDRSFLKIQPGFDPLTVTLEGYQLPDLKPQSDRRDLTFTFSTSEFELPITESLTLTIQLPKPLSAAADNTIQPFWRDIDVTDVKLERQAQRGDGSTANVPQSTIISGTVSMVERQLSLKKGQFLLIDPPATQNLGYIQILYPNTSKNLALQLSNQAIQIDEPTDGLSVAISGETSRIQAGLNKKLPVPPRLQGNLLSRFLPGDAIVALLSFCGGLVASLLMWLVNSLSKTNSEKT
ncbi:MAG: hypothetical protein KME42_24910 [Tildeniella nuda ZEHNDER 1965/U140]|jgi:hypothetical protein|nr:hypothetical protein [Tildeniella nuda ZEHNDER 1965/U140]